MEIGARQAKPPNWSLISNMSKQQQLRFLFTQEGWQYLQYAMIHSCLFHILDIHNWGRRRIIHSQFGELRVGSRPYPTKPVLMKQCYHTQHCLSLSHLDLSVLFITMFDNLVCNYLISLLIKVKNHFEILYANQGEHILV